MSRHKNIVFVTVGSTRFDALVDKVISEEVILSLKSKGFEKMVIQTGHSNVPSGLGLKENEDMSQGNIFGLLIEVWPFRPSLKEMYEDAELVIGHAGSGTIIEVLRLGKRMIAVPNETLLHNHQAELAEALDAVGYLVSSSVRDLAVAIGQATSKKFERFPEYDASKFNGILDEEMGFNVAA
ncbi:glycosyltransferase family 1 protein [Serendipita vermifera MAFF 305830]|uniref:UDP-N-acetylglucosamine transferase subunit ALG13 n=1 Tax=Serendipita vermifera MAFF 305830 TaxID=933852 RepID=A0A0C3BA62_SERVB|nr:glycosyltransferase family 1 protein [Serendipita vermifera MAFF 305830]